LIVKLVGLFFAAVLGLAFGSDAAKAADAMGVVLLHDKDSGPERLAELSGRLTGAGVSVETPETCWSHKRIYDRSFAHCMLEVDAAIARLRAKGSTRIVVGGIGLGTLAALAYADAHPDLAGVIGIEPAANPANLARVPEIAWQIVAAQAAVTYGQGDTAVRFADQVQGKTIAVSATPRNYLDFIGPHSPVLIAQTLPRLKVPLLWIAGRGGDPQSLGPAAFKRAPANKLSQSLAFDIDQANLPTAATSAILRWLRTIGGK
jgi:pimeloyl-ACP methyl ester carboxylesterase